MNNEACPEANKKVPVFRQALSIKSSHKKYEACTDQWNW
jgi:hypothetical protein